MGPTAPAAEGERVWRGRVRDWVGVELAPRRG